jgi:hypothetical protein
MLFGETVAVYSENHTEHTKIHWVGRVQSFSMLKRVTLVDRRRLTHACTPRRASWLSCIWRILVDTAAPSTSQFSTAFSDECPFRFKLHCMGRPTCVLFKRTERTKMVVMITLHKTHRSFKLLFSFHLRGINSSTIQTDKEHRRPNKCKS